MVMLSRFVALSVSLTWKVSQCSVTDMWNILDWSKIAVYAYAVYLLCAKINTHSEAFEEIVATTDDGWDLNVRARRDHLQSVLSIMMSCVRLGGGHTLRHARLVARTRLSRRCGSSAT